MRIVVPDRASASALAERLTSVVGSERVSLRGQRRQVDVSVDHEPDGAIVSLVDAVERWFEHARVASAEMWLGDRSYRFARWTRGDT